MAQLINLRETEYQTIVTELSKMHTDQLECVRDVISRLSILALGNDLFYAEKTSRKMKDMLDLVTSDIIVLLEQAFKDSEAGVANMISSITITDSACS
ncbi:MAG: hypothetical protein K2N85_11585 [Lachnospiraceae bacterium]|nr:hypothetical protein [Lachnospiraceae bacterium]